ncbi:MAG: type VII secretion-associated protein [Mycobacterium sp.]
MRAHRAIIETGPGAIRQLCCCTDASGDEETIRAALDGVDDRVVLLGDRPVAVESLWRAALRSLSCGPGMAWRHGVVIVHPSWWPSSRVSLVTTAAATLTGDVLARPRSWLLTRASDAPRGATVIVEIAERLVVVTGAEVVAVPRRAEPHVVAEKVAQAVGATAAVVVVDAAGAVAGAPELAALIAGAVRDGGRTVAQIDDAGLARLARSAPAEPSEPPTRPRGARLRAPRPSAFAACAVVLTAFPLAVSALTPAAPVDRHAAAADNRVETVPTTFLVEGRVALTVPADWPTQRVVAGTGSARVQVTSPSDPEVALHVTQSPVTVETLRGAAERLKRAIDAEPAGVFVDYNPSGSTAGRPAVTYREVRATHHVRWTVFVDGPVRISVGCQSRPGDDDAVREACEQAVRSAHAIG